MGAMVGQTVGRYFRPSYCVRVPPANRVEALRGDHVGPHSIRINDQWRICFIWRDGHAHEVEIVDYH
jgi:proteic killer suppression protein